MKITICGSIAFIDEMLSTKKELEKMGHEIQVPISQVKDDNGSTISAKEYYKIRKMADENQKWIWDRKAELVMSHFNKVAWAESILVLNHEKNDTKGYIGGNTLMEIGLAFFLNKKIYLLNQIPELSYKEEILGMKPIVLNGNLGQII